MFTQDGLFTFNELLSMKDQTRDLKDSKLDALTTQRISTMICYDNKYFNKFNNRPTNRLYIYKKHFFRAFSATLHFTDARSVRNNLFRKKYHYQNYKIKLLKNN